MDLSSFVPDLSSLGGWGYLFVIVLVCSSTPLPIFGTELVVFLAGSMANPLLVGIVAGIAASIGEMTTYLIGRGGEKVLDKKHKEGKYYGKAVEMFKKWGFGAVVIFAFTPLPMDLIGLVAGTVKYDIKKFFAATLIGKIPRNILIAYAGAVGVSLFF